MTGYKVPKSLIEEKRGSTTADLIEAIEALGEEELDGWQTGVPTEEGDYVVKTKANYTVLTYKDGLWWISDNVPIPPSIGYVRAYGQKITPYKEG